MSTVGFDEVIAVDGPSGTGKSTVARAAARRLQLRYLDTGAMYRAVTWAALESGLAAADADRVAGLAESLRLEVSTDPAEARVSVDGHRVDRHIRSAEVTVAVSAVSAIPGVRRHLVAAQRQLIGVGGFVVEGRDIGTVVAPDARLKVFLTASPDARALRRARQDGRTASADIQATAQDLRRRDDYDSARSISPLRRADDAIELDTTGLSLEEVVHRLVDMARRRGIDRGTVDPAESRPAAERGSPGTPAKPSSAAGGTASGGAAPGSATAPHPGPPPGPTEPRGVAGRAAGAELPPARRASGTSLMTVTRLAARLLGAWLTRLEVRGLATFPASGGTLLAINHSSVVDGPLVYGVLPRPAVFLVKAEMFAGPAGGVLRRIGQIPVRRGVVERAPLHAALATLAAGGVVGVFPAGTRDRGEVERFRHGVAWLALRSGCPVMPVACHGTAAVLPPGHRWPRWRRPVRVTIGPALELPAQRPSRQAVMAGAEAVRDALAAELAASQLSGGPAHRPRGGGAAGPGGGRPLRRMALNGVARTAGSVAQRSRRRRGLGGAPAPAPAGAAPWDRRRRGQDGVPAPGRTGAAGRNRLDGGSETPPAPRLSDGSVR